MTTPKPIVCAGCGAYVFGNGGNVRTPQLQPHQPQCKQATVLFPRFVYVD